MAEAYCVKCKAKKEMVDPNEETMKNGRPILKGKCPDCGTTICKILPSKKQFFGFKKNTLIAPVTGAIFLFAIAQLSISKKSYGIGCD